MPIICLISRVQFVTDNFPEGVVPSGLRSTLVFPTPFNAAERAVVTALLPHYGLRVDYMTRADIEELKAGRARPCSPREACGGSEEEEAAKVRRKKGRVVTELRVCDSRCHGGRKQPVSSIGIWE